jgi:hypothetical protein
MNATRCLLLTLLLTGAGCLKLPSLVWEAKPPVKKEVEKPPPAPVVPEEISEGNAGQMIDALQAELDYAANERPVGMSRLTPSKAEK